MFKCKTCEALRKENDYLKKLVDSLLIKKGVQPVYESDDMQLDETEDEKMARALKERGAIQYGY